MIEYNPEGSLLRTDQLELVKMLQVFSDICEKNGIRWWLCSGTLLGAARNGGFIPWDDDIDVSMLKEDYRKLEKILAAMDSDEYFFQSIDTDPEYVNIFGRFRKKEGGRNVTADPRTAFYKYKGIGFDIFCIEKSSRFAAHMAKTLYFGTQKFTLHMKNTAARQSAIRFVKALNRLVLIPFCRLVGLVNPKGQYHYELGSGFYKSPFYHDDIFPLSRITFEGVDFPAPGNTDAYLTKIYGDWRKLPSEASIRKSIHCQDYIDEIFGTEE